MTNFFNWESSPVHPVAISPDSSRLVVCNLPDNRLEVFDISSGKPSAIGSVPVGLDPVSVRFRTASEIWVVNYISDSINIIAFPEMRVLSTIATANEPSDIVFAGKPQRAFLSCAQPGLIQVYDTSTYQLVTNLVIEGQRPRAMATSLDNTTVYVAIFESGNASTIIGTGISSGFPRANPVNFPTAPSGGQNPPPNRGTNFVPAINPATSNQPPPRVGLIVKKSAFGQWLDGNHGDWTEFIRGTNAAFTGRFPGWDMPDHDLAIIDGTTLSTRYASGLMNICMALAVNPASRKICVVGTDAINQVRFGPVLNGVFVRVELAQVDPNELSSAVRDLNPHLDYQTSQVEQVEREKSIGDPRAIVWSSDGSRGYITGMGSDNLIIIDSKGQRATLGPIDLGQGPTGMALDEGRHRLYVYNRFAGSVTTVDTAAETVIDTVSLFDPTPSIIKSGRPHLYNTHETSGLGQAACASCHVDARFDRLAWDLGDPTGVVQLIGREANFGNFVPSVTNDYHPMKGPMVTQTLQDIVGHEPFHWRGDRAGIEQFNGTFTNLQGAVSSLATNEMQELKEFLATIHLGPNPFRQFDNSLSTNLPLIGQRVLGRGELPFGATLPNGNARAGQTAFRLTSGAGCIPCHTLPAGLGTDMHFNGFQWQSIPPGSNSEHHVALVQLERSKELPFKVPSLRNLFDKFGLDFLSTNSISGFGFSHDGSVDSLVRFIQDAFSVTNDQTTADLTAFLLSLTGSDLLPGALNDVNRSPGVPSLDTPAAVGRQITISNSDAVPMLQSMLVLAASTNSRVELVAKGFKDGLARGWLFDRASGNFLSDRSAEIVTPDELRLLAGAGSEQTYTIVPRGCGMRIGIDRDGDGYLDRDELDFGSDPANPLSLATNTPPRLAPMPNVMALKGRLLTLRLSAVDSDIPPQQLTFGLGANAPPGASLNPTNGWFTWTPGGQSGTCTNFITVVVTDNGTPNLSDSNAFSIVVTDLEISALMVEPTETTITWSAIPGLSYQLQYKERLTDPIWIYLPGQITATNSVASFTDSGQRTNRTRFYRLVALP